MHTKQSHSAAVAVGGHAHVSHRPALGRAHAPAARRSRLPRLWHFAAEYLLMLPLGAAIALVWANVWPESYFRLAFRLQFAVNDVAMVLFFALMMKEVGEATVPGGVLHSWRRAALPLVAAIGVTVVPAILFATIVPYLDEPRLVEGWPVVFATDLALGYFFARVIFGAHPVVPFFILLAIAANALGILAVGLAGETASMRLDIFVALMAAALVSASWLRQLRLRSFWPYVLIAGGLSWLALYAGGLTPAFALVPIVPFMPHARRDPGFFVDAEAGDRDTLSRFELWCRHPAQIALLLFALVNAGVPLKALYVGTWGLPLALLIGKPLGLALAVGAALALGLHLPARVGARELTVVAALSTIGFTVALFFASAAIGPGPALSAIKMGALVSIGGGALALVTAAGLRAGRFGRDPADRHAKG